MVDWSQPKYSKKWYKMDKLMIVSIILFPLTVLIHVVWFLLMDDELSMLFSVILIITLFPILTIFLMMYIARKGMWLKVIPDDDETIIPAIEKALRDNKIPFTKLRTGDKIVMFPMKYSEIFDMNLYDFQIRVLKRSAPGCVIEVGPSNPENEQYVENIKSILDSAFTNIET